MIKYGPPEQVYVENDWYDGPRAGIADINEMPHRFKSLFDEEKDEDLGTYMVWPVDKNVLDLEIEQWRIFVEWNTLYESGQADTDSHPGHGAAMGGGMRSKPSSSEVDLMCPHRRSGRVLSLVALKERSDMHRPDLIMH